MHVRLEGWEERRLCCVQCVGGISGERVIRPAISVLLRDRGQSVSKLVQCCVSVVAGGSGAGGGGEWQCTGRRRYTPRYQLAVERHTIAGGIGPSEQCMHRVTTEGVMCAVCGGSFRRPGDLKRHKCTEERRKLVEEQAGSVQCTVCQRWFLSAGGLSIHKKVHQRRS